MTPPLGILHKCSRCGRIEGCGTHLSSQTHQKYNHLWNSSHRKPGGKRAEDLLYCTTEAACTVEHKLSAPAMWGHGYCGNRLCWHAYQVASQNLVSSRHPLREEYRAAPFPGPSHLTPQLGAGCGWRGPGGTLSEAPGPQVAAQGTSHSCSYSTPTSQPQPRTDLGQTQQRGTQTLGLPLGRTGGNFTGDAQVRCDHVGLLLRTHLLWDRHS